MRARRLAPFLALALAAASVGVAAATSRAEDWRSPMLLGLLLALAIAADRFPVRTRSGSEIVGSLPAFVLSAVLMGPGPGALVGIAASLLQPRKEWRYVAGDIGVFATFPVVVGLAARAFGEPTESVWFIVVVTGAFLLAWTLNALLVAVYIRLLRGQSLGIEFGATWRPLLSSQLAHGLGSAAVAYLYIRLGSAAIVLASIVLVTYSRLQRDLLEAERLRDEAQARNAELAAANRRLRRSHYGAMHSLVRSIHLHDHMTARHSAAVARYALGIAVAAGCSEADQHLVHTAGLLHDVGKHIFDDAILKGGTKLTDEQWELVKRHPEEGARIVRLLEGHDDVAEIIHAHHERIDGRGYPRGLAGDEIPLLSRMISVADTYDVMTARDSYREPVSHEDAIAELRRVAGGQLDAHLVEVFVQHVVGTEEVGFVHGDDADFEAELGFEERIRAGLPGLMPAPALVAA